MKRTHLKSSNNRVNIQELNKDDDHNHSYYKNSSKGHHHHHHLHDGLITWPPKNYTCSFCRREFRSAQALGGHMNVHRRDRAKLRQLPSWLLESPHFSVPNPNPSFPSSYSSISPPASSFNFLTPHSSFYNLVPTQKIPATAPRTRIDLSNPNNGDSTKDVPCIREFKSNIAAYNASDKCNLARDLRKKAAGEVISVELGMGLKDSKQVLDLELRLGCFN